MAAEELVQRVLARHVERQPAPAPPRAPPHLPQRGDRPGERDADRRVQRADVDPELQRVGRDDAEQLAGDQPPLQLPPLLGRVARAVGRDPLRQRRIPAPLQLVGRELRHQLDGLARLHEDDRPRALDHEPTSRFAASASAEPRSPRRVVDHRRVPHRDRRGACRASRRGRSRARRPGRSASRPARPGWRRSLKRAGTAARSRRTRRSAAAAAARWPRASRRCRGRRAPRRPRRPPGCGRNRPTPGGSGGSRRAACPGWSARGSPAAQLRAVLARRVAVVDRRPLALEAERVQRARLVLRQRLRRVQEQRPPAASVESICSVGSWKHSDLPDAVPVVTIVVRSNAESNASAWWLQRKSMPRCASAARTSGCSSGGSATICGRARAAAPGGPPARPRGVRAARPRARARGRLPPSDPTSRDSCR